jgi:hypothetical protein
MRLNKVINRLHAGLERALHPAVDAGDVLAGEEDSAIVFALHQYDIYLEDI